MGASAGGRSGAFVAARMNRRRRAAKLDNSLVEFMRFLFRQAGFPPQPGTDM
jgi:hypothetical protein